MSTQFQDGVLMNTTSAIRSASSFKRLSYAAFISAGLLLAGCSADGNLGAVGGLGPVTNSGDDGMGGTIGDGFPVTPVDGTGGMLPGPFLCTESLQASGGATTQVGTGGLVGGPLGDLVNLIGGGSVTTLLNSVTDKDLAIDGDLATGSTFTLTLDLLGIVSNVEQTVFAAPGFPLAAGKFAVFALGFPIATLELSLINTITVTTLLGDAERETISVSPLALDLLGAVQAGEAFTFLGLRATQSFDRVRLSLEPGLLSANVGEALKVYELCTGLRQVAL
jgi:hypothetical protein